jgi:hypothetical protein
MSERNRAQAMTQRIRLFAGLLATLIIASFFSASLFSELLGSTETIVAVKALIAMPGLFLLIPAIVARGVSGFIL